MSTTGTEGTRPHADEPTTEEALPNVDLSTDPKTERIARETLGPEAAEDDEDGAGTSPPTDDR